MAFHNRKTLCFSCEHYGDHRRGGVIRTGCGLLDRPCDVETAWMKSGGNWCPIGKQPESDQLLLGPAPRDTHPAGTVVITAADQAFLRGAYLLLWTLLRTNDCKTILYDLGFDHDNPMVRQMQRWGVEIREGGRIVPESVPGWQVFNKPVYIADAMSDHPRVVWLDADTSIGDSITEIYDLLDDGPFVPNHGPYYPPANHTSPALREFFGPARREWSGNDWPCAGVVALDSQRDKTLMAEWLDRTERLNRERPDLLPEAQYYDQVILQDILDCELADGHKWNNLNTLRTGTVAEILTQTYRHEAIISHYGGKKKPFEDWDTVLRWRDPYDLDS